MRRGESAHILAIDIGGSKIRAGIVDPRGRILAIEREELEGDSTFDAVMARVLRILSELEKKPIYREVTRAGATVPGLADPERGLWIYSPFSGIREAPLQSILSESLEMPVAIENDVNACALAEFCFGVCQGIENFIWITVSNGIGGGIVLDGKIYRGCSFNAGEIGHVNVEEGGRLCGCGNRGCLEAYASGASIAKRYAELMKGQKEGIADIDAKAIGVRARNGDKIALQIYHETGRFLGRAISHAVNLLNPQKVVLGGGVATDLELFLPSLEKTLDEFVFREANRGLCIEQTAFLSNAGLIGAAVVAMG